MTTRELREQAADLVERGWCQRHYALDAAGQPVNERGSEAVRWCLYGALHAVMPDLSGPSWSLTARVCDELRAELALPASKDLGNWNDHVDRTQAEVVAALRGST